MQISGVRLWAVIKSSINAFTSKIIFKNWKPEDQSRSSNSPQQHIYNGLASYAADYSIFHGNGLARLSCKNVIVRQHGQRAGQHAGIYGRVPMLARGRQQDGQREGQGENINKLEGTR